MACRRLRSCNRFQSKPEIYILLDATRATHIEGLGTYGSGFLNDPIKVLAKLRQAGVGVVSYRSMVSVQIHRRALQIRPNRIDSQLSVD